MKGVIKKKMPNEKGFGFITGEGETTDTFFHQEALVGVTFEELQEGDAVTFDTEPSKDPSKGPRAVNVQRA